MTDDPERLARGILAELEERLATHDLERMDGFFTRDAVLIGDDAEHFDRDAITAYLGSMADMSPTVRWDWGRLAVVLETPGLLAFAAAGSLAFHDSAGAPLGAAHPFRLTCFAIQEQAGWRVKHPWVPTRQRGIGPARVGNVFAQCRVINASKICSRSLTGADQR